MPESPEHNEGNTADLVRRMSAGASVVERVIPFANDDVPKYLAKLRRFEKESQKVEILVR